MRCRRTARGGFTLTEVLATLLLISLVLPSVMQGVSLATAAADTARRRSEATALAESKLNELVVTNQWQTGNLSGDFGPEWPDYSWQAEVLSWEQPTVRQLQVHVVWTARGRPHEVTLPTLVYANSSGMITGTGTGAGTGGGQTP